MRNVHDNVISCVGDTPLVRLNSVTAGLAGSLYAKVEYMNPGSSVKDRIALKIIEDAERDGLLKPGGTIVEATSGNTGAGLAMVAAIKGYKCIFVLPDKQSEEKRAALRAYGARVVVTPTNVEPEDPRSYYSVSRRLADETPNAFYANQYHNPSNPAAHYEITGPELWEQTEGTIDAFIAGLGTGGTVTGTGRYLKEKNDKVQIVGVDPVGLALLRLLQDRAAHRRLLLRAGGHRRGLPAHHDGLPVRRRRGPGERQGVLPDDAPPVPRGGAVRGRLLRRSGGWRAQVDEAQRPPGTQRRRGASRQRQPLHVEDLQRQVDGGERLPRHPGQPGHRGPIWWARPATASRSPSTPTCA